MDSTMNDDDNDEESIGDLERNPFNGNGTKAGDDDDESSSNATDDNSDAIVEEFFSKLETFNTEEILGSFEEHPILRESLWPMFHGGGLYLSIAHMNHSCEPNVEVSTADE